MNIITTKQKIDKTFTTWNFFQKHRWVAPGFSNSPILKSWERCIHITSPHKWTRPHVASGITLDSFLKRNNTTGIISRTQIENLLELLPERECSVVICDETGCTLDIIGSSRHIENGLFRLGFKPGAFWSEERIGTNAISLCLEGNRPVTVYGAENFNVGLHEYACHASIVFDAFGQTKACIMMVMTVECLGGEYLALIESCAQNISSQLQIDECIAETNQILCQRNVIYECMDEGVFSWNKEGMITFVNKHVSEKMSLDMDKTLNKSINSIFLFPPILKNAIKKRKKLSHVDVIIECNREFVEAFVTLRPLSDGGFLFVMHPMEEMRRIAQRQLSSNVKFSFDDFIANSKKMKQVINVAKRACKTKTPILLQGEDGVGKNKLALAIHNQGEFKNGPFLSINCKSFEPENQILEFLGSDSGEGSTSKFELANGGTIYIQQVEYLCSEVQSVLLQLLKTDLLVRSNSNRMIPIYFQLICSASSDLDEYVSKQSFGRQLYYSISSIDLEVPTLRQRKEDIEDLIKRQINRLGKRYNTVIDIAPEALEVLIKYSWPGNITELKNKIEKTVLNRKADLIQLEDLPNSVLHDIDRKEDSWVASIQSLESLEKNAIIQALDAFDGRISDIAGALKISRTTLWRKIKKYNIKGSTHG